MKMVVDADLASGNLVRTVTLAEARRKFTPHLFDAHCVGERNCPFTCFQVTRGAQFPMVRIG